MPKDNKTPKNRGRLLAIVVLVITLVAAVGVVWAIIASKKEKEIQRQQNVEKANEEIQNYLQSEGWKNR